MANRQVFGNFRFAETARADRFVIEWLTQALRRVKASWLERLLIVRQIEISVAQRVIRDLPKWIIGDRAVPMLRRTLFDAIAQHRKRGFKLAL